jgi:hypothetical protein
LVSAAYVSGHQKSNFNNNKKHLSPDFDPQGPDLSRAHHCHRGQKTPQGSGRDPRPQRRRACTSPHLYRSAVTLGPRRRSVPRPPPSLASCQRMRTPHAVRQASRPDDGRAHANDEGVDGPDLSGPLLMPPCPLLAPPGTTAAADTPRRASAAAPGLGHRCRHTLHREKSSERRTGEKILLLSRWH